MVHKNKKNKQSENQKNSTRNPTIDHFLSRGLSLRTLALFTPSDYRSHEGVRNYIDQTGQRNAWEKAKRNLEENAKQREEQEKQKQLYEEKRKNAIENVLTQIEQRALHTASEKEIFIIQQTERFLSRTGKPHCYTFSQLHYLQQPIIILITLLAGSSSHIMLFT